ncbi:MAG: transposase [Desulfamplus sp.]|nr:transposase [Desulfamplus sp.]
MIASKQISRQDEIERIPIEGKFGQAKRRFSLSRIMCRPAQTSETAIAIVFLVMNLHRWMKALFLNFFLHFVTNFVKEQRQIFVLL